MIKITIIFILLVGTSLLLGQGVGFPSEPSQAPIGGLELLIGAGGAMAWKRLRNKK